MGTKVDKICHDQVRKHIGGRRKFWRWGKAFTPAPLELPLTPVFFPVPRRNALPTVTTTQSLWQLLRIRNGESIQF